MTRFAVLTHPGTNRVYGQVAPALALAEIATIAALLPDLGFGAAELVERAGIAYVDVEADARASSALASLASTYALFVVRDDLLEPIAAPVPRVFADDLLTIQRYPGKTNEQFTALMLRLAQAAARPATSAPPRSGAGVAERAALETWLDGTRLRVLDPLCGRGTTLNQALRDGCDAVGIEQDKKDVEAYLSFITRYLETNKIKHRRSTAKPQPDGRRTLRATYTITPKVAGGPMPDALTLDIIGDDTRFLRDHLKGSSVHVIVTDLPYGIQHGARADARGPSRNPAALLDEALPAWRGVLRGGGAIALSYNTKVIGREVVDAALTAAGFDVVDLVTDGRFSHRVDQSIQRDLSLATKPG